MAETRGRRQIGDRYDMYDMYRTVLHGRGRRYRCGGVSRCRSAHTGHTTHTQAHARAMRCEVRGGMRCMPTDGYLSVHDMAYDDTGCTLCARCTSPPCWLYLLAGRGLHGAGCMCSCISMYVCTYTHRNEHATQHPPWVEAVTRSQQGRNKHDADTAVQTPPRDNRDRTAQTADRPASPDGPARQRL